MDNLSPGLEHGWHPVGLAGAEPPWRLLGREWTNAHSVCDRFGLRWVAPFEPRAPLPEVAEDDDPTMTRMIAPVGVWRAGAAQMADNFADLGHLPFVHATSFADPDEAEVPRIVPVVTETGFSIEHRHRTMRLHGDGTGRRRMVIEVTAPFTVVLRLEYLDDDAVVTTLFAHQPVDGDTTVLWVVLWRDDIVDGRATVEGAIAFQQLVAEEDRRIVEALDSNAIALDLTVEVHTLADRPTVELRRLLTRFLA
ncbi:MAG: hypothetical protein ABJH68_10390 [Ilumatobacter sp.]|uniref:hypothetical protein n=1 Tax=Ilumatobacter sp. TaxID=1967498 RepID=UPI00329849A1